MIFKLDGLLSDEKLDYVYIIMNNIIEGIKYVDILYVEKVLFVVDMFLNILLE